jgi:hypothetical protein
MHREALDKAANSQSRVNAERARDFPDPDRKQKVLHYLMNALDHYKNLDHKTQSKYRKSIEKKYTHGGGLLDEYTGDAGEDADDTLLGSSLVAFDIKNKIKSSRYINPANLWDARFVFLRINI